MLIEVPAETPLSKHLLMRQQWAYPFTEGAPAVCVPDQHNWLAAALERVRPSRQSRCGSCGWDLPDNEKQRTTHKEPVDTDLTIWSWLVKLQRVQLRAACSQA
jgi:hypothetical protein